MDGIDGRVGQRLDAASRDVRDDSATDGVNAAPAGRFHTPDAGSQPPPVGLNWGVVARQLGTDLSALQHSGSIIVAGESFPARGYFFEGGTLRARWVELGDISLSHGYFLDELALHATNAHVPSGGDTGNVAHPVIPDVPEGPVIGLFASEHDATRAHDRIMHASIGAGMRLESGPLGVELHVDRPELPGRVATAMAAYNGAIIAIGGTPLEHGASEVGTATRS